MLTVKEIREQTKMTQREFVRVTGIPLSTLQHWEQGYSSPPEYLPPLLKKALKYDGYIKRRD